jgi:hypothetical protein
MGYRRWRKNFSPIVGHSRSGCKRRHSDGAGASWVRPRSLAKGEPVIPAITSLASALSKIMSLNSEILSAAGRSYAEELNRARIGQAPATAACLTLR